MKKNTAVYPGSFDPITLGHEDLIKRALAIFDHVMIAIGANEKKTPFFSVEERIALIKEIFHDEERLSIVSFDGLLVDFLKQSQSRIVIRGIRAVSDFDFEFQLAGMNRILMPNIETLFLMPADQYTFISSSLVRVIAEKNGDISKFVSPSVEKLMKEKLS